MALEQANSPGLAPGGLFIPSTLELTANRYGSPVIWRSQGQPFSVVFRSLSAVQIRLIPGAEFVDISDPNFAPNSLI